MDGSESNHLNPPNPLLLRLTRHLSIRAIYLRTLGSALISYKPNLCSRGFTCKAVEASNFISNPYIYLSVNALGNIDKREKVYLVHQSCTHGRTENEALIGETIYPKLHTANVYEANSFRTKTITAKKTNKEKRKKTTWANKEIKKESQISKHQEWSFMGHEREREKASSLSKR